MLIVVDSITGTSLKFALKTGHTVLRIKDRKDIGENEKFLLITRCQNFGEVPLSTKLLLDKHGKNCIGVAVSGNRNWGKHYGVSGDIIERDYGIKCVLKFEGTGYPHEVDELVKYIEEFERNYNG